MNHPLRTDDQQAVMDAVGPVAPLLLREAIDHGFHNYCVSRRLDPVGSAELSSCARANILYDRIAAVIQDLIESDGQQSGIRWKLGGNQRATVMLMDPFFAFRMKRSKKNRGGLTTSVKTRNQRRIKSPPPILTIGQGVLDLGPCSVPPIANQRLWLTATWDLDDAEEAISECSIGVELPERFLWRVPLPEPQADVIASLPNQLADRMLELRDIRSA